MRYLTLSLAALFAFSLTAACEDDGGAGSGGDGGADSSSGGTGSGATVNSGAGEPSAAGGEPTSMGGGTGSGTCLEEAETLNPDLGAFGAGIAVSETSIAYVTRVDAGTATDLSVMAHDAGGDGVIYSSALGFAIGSITWSEDNVLFLEAPDGDSANALYTIPGAGGDPVQIGAATFESGRLLGADADAAYVYEDGLTMSAILRVTLADGAVETVATVPPPGAILHPVFAGDEIFFLGGDMASIVYRVATADTDGDATEVFAAADSPGCGFPLGGLVATPTKLVCGYQNVAAIAREDGTVDGVIVEGDLTKAPAHVVVASSEESIYTIELNDGSFDATMRRVSSDGSDEVPLVCDVGRVATQLTDAFFPISNHYQIGVGGGRIVWVEERVSDDDVVTTSIRSAPL
jgi:hypothetical protein